MSSVETLPMVFASGWASGINAYGAILVMGLLGRYAHTPHVPATLERGDVLAIAAVMFAIEFVVDKIPYLDSAWDTVHTVVRPVLGAVVGGLIGHEAGSTMNDALATVTGGGTALGSHLVKSGFRVAVNTSPEPFSNVITSFSEDVASLGVAGFALEHPIPAAVVAAVLLVVGALVVIYLLKRIRRGMRWVQRRLSASR